MSVILIAFVCIIHAFLCLLPGFIVGLFFNIERFKKWIFLLLAIIFSLFLLPKNATIKSGAIHFLWDFAGIYGGLILLYGFRNMAQKLGLCKFCEKFRRKH